MDGGTLFFLFYVGVLALSGVLMLILAGVGFGAKPGARVLNGVLGLAALAYAIYLVMTVFIDGGTYRIFFYAFILPVFAVVQMVKSFKARAEQNAAAQMQPMQPMQYGQQVPYAPPPMYAPHQQQASRCRRVSRIRRADYGSGCRPRLGWAAAAAPDH